MPEGTEQERAHPARAGAGLPPLYCTSRCLRVGQLKMFLQSICRRWYDQRHFSSTVQSFPQPNGLATQTPAHPQDKEHPDWSKFISKETLGSFQPQDHSKQTLWMFPITLRTEFRMYATQPPPHSTPQPHWLPLPPPRTRPALSPLRHSSIPASQEAIPPPDQLVWCLPRILTTWVICSFVYSLLCRPPSARHVCAACHYAHRQMARAQVLLG